MWESSYQSISRFLNRRWMSFCHKNSNLPFSINHGFSVFFFRFSIFSSVFQSFLCRSEAVFLQWLLLSSHQSHLHMRMWALNNSIHQKNYSTKSTNNNSSEQTTTDELIFTFLAYFRFNFLLSPNNIEPNKTDQIHTRQR